MDSIKKHKKVVECKNCGTAHQFKYCPNCGQIPCEDKFTLKESISWLFSEVFNLNKGFFFTTKELLVRPKQTIQKYLNRGTKQYYHPFRFIFVWATISSLLIVIAGVYDNYTQFNFTNQPYSEEQIEKMQKVFELIKTYQSLIVMLGLPFVSLGSWLVYKRRNQNYTEHLIMTCFTYGASIAVSIPFMLILLLPNGVEIYSIISALLYLIVYAFIFSKFFEENIIISFLKVLAFNIIAVISGIVVGFIVAIPAVIIYKSVFS